jgi:hypothetical protein
VVVHDRIWPVLAAYKNLRPESSFSPRQGRFSLFPWPILAGVPRKAAIHPPSSPSPRRTPGLLIRVRIILGRTINQFVGGKIKNSSGSVSISPGPSRFAVI